jgi:hypothetical protein
LSTGGLHQRSLAAWRSLRPTDRELDDATILRLAEDPVLCADVVRVARDGAPESRAWAVLALFLCDGTSHVAVAELLVGDPNGTVRDNAEAVLVGKGYSPRDIELLRQKASHRATSGRIPSSDPYSTRAPGSPMHDW